MAMASRWRIPTIGVLAGIRGPTQLLEHAIVTLTKAGFRVAALVHRTDDKGIDKRRSDSDRLRRAGATAVGLIAQAEIGVYTPRLATTGKRWIAVTLAGLASPPDLIVHDNCLDGGPDPDLIAIISDRRVGAKVPVLRAEDTNRLLGLLGRRGRQAMRASTPSPRSVPTVAIVGHKNSGKTTLAERLIAAFSKDGLEVAAVKHTSDERGFDKPHADTGALTAAGAVAVGMVTMGEAGFYTSRDTGASAAWVETVLAAAPLAPDLILYEGFRAGRHPKIECVRDPSVVAPTTPLADGLLAVVSNRDLVTTVPVLDSESVKPIAQVIRQALRLAAPRTAYGGE
jgi:molybdopterin-guanine dinucleotide biosynthesis protein B